MARSQVVAQLQMLLMSGLFSSLTYIANMARLCVRPILGTRNMGYASFLGKNGALKLPALLGYRGNQASRIER